MEISINYWAVLVSAVVSMGIGAVWYGKLFMKPWMELSGITPPSTDQMKSAQAAANKSYLMQFVASIITAYVFSYFVDIAGIVNDISGWQLGVVTGLWLWFGFVAPLSLGSVMWEGKSWKLWFINSSNWLVTFVVMGAILGAWQ